jgi:hypothetical protein
VKHLSSAFALMAVVTPLFMAGPAKAQFGTAAFPRAASVEGETPAKGSQSTTVVVYPLCAFDVQFPGGNATKYGVLSSVETAFPGRTGRSATIVGGWYWSGADSGIYELHAKQYFTPEFGVQAGVIGGTKVSGFVTDAFAVFNLDGRRVTPHCRQDWSMQFAAGGHGGQSSGFTGYWQGSLSLSEKWSLNMSYWYVRETPFDFHRVAVGAGYRF